MYWKMSLETIFRHPFKIWWDNWKIEKNKILISGNCGILENSKYIFNNGNK